jgi:hypothetical protein
VNYVKSSKRRRGGGGGESCGACEMSGRKSKKVRTRNQRADINMINPLQGLFGKFV